MHDAPRLHIFAQVFAELFNHNLDGRMVAHQHDDLLVDLCACCEMVHEDLVYSCLVAVCETS